MPMVRDTLLSADRAGQRLAPGYIDCPFERLAYRRLRLLSLLLGPVGNREKKGAAKILN